MAGSYGAVGENETAQGTPEVGIQTGGAKRVGLKELPPELAHGPELVYTGSSPARCHYAAPWKQGRCGEARSRVPKGGVGCRGTIRW